ncbi:MAG TPA: HAD hydrolase-like protein, partial [Atribacterota bacterium]|nr:HAD hydrolase-like protein [Atribacterota bacterium]
LYSRYKPRRKPFREAMKIMNTNNKETAVVGDQIFTDIWGGNRLQLLTILVCPLSRSDSLGTTIISRVLEGFLLSILFRNGKIELTKGKWPN